MNTKNPRNGTTVPRGIKNIRSISEISEYLTEISNIDFVRFLQVAKDWVAKRGLPIGVPQH